MTIYTLIDMNNLSKDVRELMPRTWLEVMTERTEKDDRLEIYNRLWLEHHNATKKKQEEGTAS